MPPATTDKLVHIGWEQPIKLQLTDDVEIASAWKLATDDGGPGGVTQIPTPLNLEIPAEFTACK